MDLKVEVWFENGEFVARAIHDRQVVEKFRNKDFDVVAGTVRGWFTKYAGGR